MQKVIEFTVTPEDIAEAKKRRAIPFCYNCPAWQALHKMFPETPITCGTTEFRINNTSYDTPKSLQEQLDNWTLESLFEPGTYAISINE